ncbi:MAG: hypothetical protein LBI76_07460, partial [Comamonas sp.]|nr:hypothetical protein [Comamonas sp.]
MPQESPSSDTAVLWHQTEPDGCDTACLWRTTNGVLSSEGSYDQGVEHGLWREFHENGQPASEGSYHHGE